MIVFLIGRDPDERTELVAALRARHGAELSIVEVTDVSEAGWRLDNLRVRPSSSVPVVVRGPDRSADAYLIREFLDRNLVAFEWDPAGSGGDGTTTVTIPDGRVLCAPSLAALASALELTVDADGEDYDVAIVGGGPTGLAAAVYAGCEGLRVVVVEDSAPGGQASSTSRIENYLGFPTGLPGAVLAQRALAQAKRFGVRWMSARRAMALGREGDMWALRTEDGSVVRAHTVLVATGMRWRPLEAAGVSGFVNAGIYYGASTFAAQQDAGEKVYVLGSGNSAGQAALFLAETARSVTLLIRGRSLAESSMSRYLVDRIHADDRVTVRACTEVASAFGEQGLEGLELRDTRTRRSERVAASSLYVLIGMAPATDWLGGSAACDSKGFLLTGSDLARDSETRWSLPDREPLICETSLPGVFAAGDVRAGTVKRIGSAVGQGAVASQVILEYLGELSPTRIPAQRFVDPARQFDVLDHDGNGYIERDDLDAMANKLVTGFNEPYHSARASGVRSAYRELWIALAGFADKDGDGQINRGEFQSALGNSAIADGALTSIADVVLALADTDGDGAVTPPEFQRLLAAMGMSVLDAGAMFRTLDTDSSGYLDIGEITSAMREFFFGAQAPRGRRVGRRPLPRA